MVEPILYAALGFLLASLLWLLFIPLFWRRAVRLTTKRLLGRLPISKSEIVAAQDRLRAEQAMTMRAVERRAEQLAADAARERLEVGRERGAELGHAADVVELREKVVGLEAEGERLKGELAKASAESGERLAATKAAEAARSAALVELNAAREDGAAARLSVDQARIEAAARETEIEALRAELAVLKRGAAALAPLGPSPIPAPPGTSSLRDDTALLSALRVRLDEVADSIARAAAAEAETPKRAKPAGEAEIVPFIPQVRESADAS